MVPVAPLGHAIGSLTLRLPFQVLLQAALLEHVVAQPGGAKRTLLFWPLEYMPLSAVTS